MINYLSNYNNIFLAFIACLFTWLITILGAMVVFLFKKVNKTLLDAMLGFAAGVMISASFFSLISPALSMSENLNINGPVIVTLGFICGGLLLFIGDKIFPKIIKKNEKAKNFKRTFMLIFSITLHNIPEGLAVGVAFGSLRYNLHGATLISAIILAFGIGLQNFPEGTAVSLPLKRDGMSSKKAFLIGSLTGIVEPIASVIGALLVLKVRTILPFLLAFAAGAMIYVVVEELIPESQTNKSKDLMAIFTILGFAVMMFLDVFFG